MHREVRRTIAGLLLGTLCSPAVADDRTFQVTARVLPRQPPTQALAALPLPPGSRQLTTGSFGASYYFAGEPEDAAAFYLAEMPRRGYRLVSVSSDGTELTWHGPQTRIELRLNRVLGTRPATRIVVFASDDG